MNSMDRFDISIDLCQQVLEVAPQIQHAKKDKTRQELIDWCSRRVTMAHLVLTTDLTEEDAYACAYGRTEQGAEQ